MKETHAKSSKREKKVKLRVKWPIAKFSDVKAVSQWRKRTTGFVTVDFYLPLSFIFSPSPSSRLIECYDNVTQRLLNTSTKAFGHFWEHGMLFIVYGFEIIRKTPVLLRCVAFILCVCAPDIVHTCDLESRSALRFSLLILMLSLLSLLNINSLFLHPSI